MSASREFQSSDGEHKLSRQDRAAADWSLRVRRGLTPEEEREFELWLAEDRQNERCFAELTTTSLLLDRLRDPAFADIPANVTALDSRGPGRRFRPLALVVTFAAAAALIFVWSNLGKTDRGPMSATDVFAATIATRSTEPRRMSLPDGSVIQLNPAAMIEVRFNHFERSVRLTQGEAYFTVAKNPLRPFYVEAGAVSVRAVGTAFNVRYQPRAVEVIVTEGCVQVRQDSRPILLASNSSPATITERLLQAGEKTVVALDRVTPAPSEMPSQTRTSAPAATVEDWRTRRLEFIDTPLSEVVAEFNRHNVHKLVIDDPALATRTFGGVFAPTGYKSFVEALERSFGIVAERKPHETVLRLAP